MYTVGTGDTKMQALGDTLVVKGDVDLYEAPHFREVAEEHIKTVQDPRFDMTEVPFLDSAGLATLLYLSRKAALQNKTLRIMIAGGPRRVLRITGIDRMLIVED